MPDQPIKIHKRFCKDCGNEKIESGLMDVQFCNKCGKITLSNIVISPQEVITSHDSIILKAKSLGFKRFKIMQWLGWFSSHKYTFGVDLDRRVDKVNDSYDEVVKDHKTGEIVHEDHGRFSDHAGHGSAKLKS